MASRTICMSKVTKAWLSNYSPLNDPVVIKAVKDDIKLSQRSVSLQTLINFGKNPTRQAIVLSAVFLHQELRVRLAHRINDLNHMPYGLNEMSACIKVKEWYMMSYNELRLAPKPDSDEAEKAFRDTLKKIYERHGPTLITLASAVYELKKKLLQEGKGDLSDYAQVHIFLDRFYISRVGIRMLIAQQLALCDNSDSADGYVGIICKHTSPRKIAEAAIQDASYVCERTLGQAPEVTIKGQTDLTFHYVPMHLHHILFELLKNSMRAVVESHQDKDDLPAIEIIIADGDKNEDVCIKISDQGGGIIRSKTMKIYDYFYTTAPQQFENLTAADFSVDTPMSGLGYGLPLSRIYARYFGGDLQIISMEGYGTDAYIHLKRVGNSDEPLPPTMYDLNSQLIDKEAALGIRGK